MSLSRRTDRLDEDDIRVRAQRGKSRPRSKVRPGHDDAGEGSIGLSPVGAQLLVLGGREPVAVVGEVARKQCGGLPANGTSLPTGGRGVVGR